MPPAVSTAGVFVRLQLCYSTDEPVRQRRLQRSVNDSRGAILLPEMRQISIIFLQSYVQFLLKLLKNLCLFEEKSKFTFVGLSFEAFLILFFFYFRFGNGIF